MKKISVLLVVLLSYIASFSQTPNNNLNNSNAQTTFGYLGPLTSNGYKVKGFPDTVTLNNQMYLKGIPGLLVRVGNNYYVRSQDVSQWILINAPVPNTPGTFIGIDSVTINSDTTKVCYWKQGVSTCLNLGGDSVRVVGDTSLCIYTNGSANCYPITGNVLVVNQDSMTVNGSLVCWYFGGTPTCITINPVGAYFNDIFLSSDSLTYDFYSNGVYIKSIPTFLKGVAAADTCIVIRDSSNGKTYWYFNPNCQGGGGGASITATELNYIPKVKLSLPYLWYNDTAWTTVNSNDWVVSGASVSIVSGKPQITGSANNYNSYYYKTSQTINIENYTMTDSLVIVNAPGATTRGFSSGIGTTVLVVGDIDLSTGVNAGVLTITTGYGGTTTLRATSSSALTFTTGDTLISIFRRLNDTARFSVKNSRTGVTVSVEYNTSPLLAEASDQYFVGGYHSIYNRGTGTYRLVRSSSVLGDSTNSSFGLLGDSKGVGIKNGATANRILNLVRDNGYDFINFSETGVALYNFLSPNSLDNLFALNVKVVLMSLGSNDFRQTRTLAQVTDDYQAVTSLLQQRGIKVYHMVLWETNMATQLASLDSFLKIRYTSEYISSVWEATKALGAAGIYAGDGVHQNSVGADTTAQNILRSGVLTYPVYTPNISSDWSGIKYPYIKNQAKIVSSNADNTGEILIGTTDFTGITFKPNGRPLLYISPDPSQPLFKSFLQNGTTESSSIVNDSLGNIGMGYQSLALMKTGDNVVFGKGSGSNRNGQYNTGLGAFNYGYGVVGSTAQNKSIHIGYGVGYGDVRSSTLLLGNNSGKDALIYADLSTGHGVWNPANIYPTNITAKSSTIFEVDGTDGGILIPRLTTTQRNALSSVPTGELIYNSTLDSLQWYYSSAWHTLGGGGGGGTTISFPNTSLNYLTGYNTFGSLNDSARAAVSLTTTGSSGAATYTTATGVFNIPNYTLSGLGGWSTSGNSGLTGSNYAGTNDAIPMIIKINGVRKAAFDTSTKSAFNVGNDPYLPTTSRSSILISDTALLSSDQNHFGLTVVKALAKVGGVAGDGALWGGYFEPRILTPNNTNWTSFYGMTGVTGSNNTQPGSTGTITMGIGVESAADYGGMTIDTAIRFRARNITKRVGATVNNAFGLVIDRQSAGGTTNAGIWNYNGNNQFIGGTMVSGTNVLLVSGTQPSSIAAASYGVNFQITGSGSSAFANGALNVANNAGYTGALTTSAITGVNTALGTGTGVLAANNRGISMTVTGVGSGSNLGGLFLASGGNINAGILGTATTLKNNATNIGGVFYGRNTGTTPIQVGVYAGLNSADPTFVSAALLVDNSDQTSPMWVIRDNGTVVSTMSDGGNLFLGGTTATATAKLHLGAGTATASTAPIKLTAGTNLTTPEAGAVEFDGTNYFATASSTRYTIAKTLTATATLNFDLTAVNSQDLTMTVTGAATGDVIALALDANSVPADVTYFGWVSATNTVTIRCSRVGGGGAADPASGTFRASVIKY